MGFQSFCESDKIDFKVYLLHTLCMANNADLIRGLLQNLCQHCFQKICKTVTMPLGQNDYILVSNSRNSRPLMYSRLSISRILRISKCLSESNIHFDCFLQPLFCIWDFFISPNYPKCKFICTSGNLNL